MTLSSHLRSWVSARRWLSVSAVIVLPGMALAQTDYSAGKTPPQLFTSDCAACHQSPQGLARGRDAGTLTGFLRDHYTTRVEWAGVLANYLVGVGGTRPRPVQQPTTGAATPRAPQPPGTIPSGSDEAAAAATPPVAAGARDRAKPGDARAAKGKPQPAESEREAAKAGTDALQNKVRNYATVGEEAKSAVPDSAGTPQLRPTNAVRSGEPGASPAGGLTPPPPGQTPGPGTPPNQRSSASPPG
jgi:mono/diheme cytochrome c family protein